MLVKKNFFIFFFSLFIISQAKCMKEQPGSDFHQMMKSLKEANAQKTNQLKIKIYDHIAQSLNKPPYKDKNGWTLFNYIIMSDNLELIKYFLNTVRSFGPDELSKYLESKDRHGNTPLHLTAKFEKTKAVKILLHYGANTVALNNEEQTPDCLTINPAISELLMTNCYHKWTKVKKKRKKEGYTLLQ